MYVLFVKLGPCRCVLIREVSFARKSTISTYVHVHVHVPLFSQGNENKGFEVLLQNFRSEVTCSREFNEFVRERSVE